MSIATILDDGHGFLWIGTHAGLVRIERARIDQALARSQR